MRYLISGVAAILLVAGCQQSSKNLQVNADQFDKLTLQHLTTQGAKPLDTVSSENGQFGFEVGTDSMDFYIVQTPGEYRIPLFLKKGEQISIDIEGQGDSLTYSIEGSPESSKINTINSITKEAREGIDSLRQVNEQARNTPNYPQVRAGLDSAFESIVSDASAKLKELIEEDPGSMANLFVFSQQIGRFRLINQMDDFDYYKMVDSALTANYPNSQHTANFSKQVENISKQIERTKELEKVKEKVSEGAQVPEISMSGPDGETHSLSDLRGNIVLVDFWAAWCRPCRAANPELVRLYNKYNDKGFEIFSVSLDGTSRQQQPKKAWIQAIEQDGLVWDHHVSELRGWRSSVVQQFGFQGIPYTVLVDRDGKIIATNLRPNGLEKKLEELLG